MLKKIVTAPELVDKDFYTFVSKYCNKFRAYFEICLLAASDVYSGYGWPLQVATWRISSPGDPSGRACVRQYLREHAWPQWGCGRTVGARCKAPGATDSWSDFAYTLHGLKLQKWAVGGVVPHITQWKTAPSTAHSCNSYSDHGHLCISIGVGGPCKEWGLVTGSLSFEQYLIYPEGLVEMRGPVNHRQQIYAKTLSAMSRILGVHGDTSWVVITKIMEGLDIDDLLNLAKICGYDDKWELWTTHVSGLPLHSTTTHEAPSVPGNVRNGTRIERKENEHIILSCPGEGTPTPTILWIKDDRTLIQDEPGIYLGDGNATLEIRGLSKNWTGKYTCIVENDHGLVYLYQYVTMRSESVVWWGIPEVLVGISIILLLILVILRLYYYVKEFRAKAERQDLVNNMRMIFEERVTVTINPKLSISEQAEFLSYDRKWEFPRDRLILGKTLGSGAFGVVVKAKALGIVPHQEITTVAVKMVHKGAEPIHLRALACELKILVHLEKHLNIVNLLGACTDNIDRRELLVIVEYCCFGDLRSYLLRHRDKFKAEMDSRLGNLSSSGDDTKLHGMGSNSLTDAERSGPNQDSVGESFTNDSGLELHCTNPSHQNSTICSSGGIDSNCCNFQPQANAKTRDESVCIQDLLSWAFQVARGMEYLSEKKILHGDLAARNILLAKDKIVKICDFGLAKTMYKYDNYQKKSDGPVPLRWMAIESIRNGVFSSQSDIWSFGIVIWEIFTVGEIPYQGMRIHKLLQLLDRGYRLEQPEYASDDVYEIMLWCWKSDPRLRPSFTQLVERFGKLLGENVETYYIELNQANVDSNIEDINGKKDYLQSRLPSEPVISYPSGESTETNPANSVPLVISTWKMNNTDPRSTKPNPGD
ncbi:hypothetical protein QAD02_004672 [Eretmocerus hayati]|uniref:Uncharacterized protein n=1 Tax=Eretmocerus hayati TaxID=131215 RepID=A0ACC2NV23_9HYME|nr:hypothetical protein QAD02_004672 [Eretmocerus hayati]